MNPDRKRTLSLFVTLLTAIPFFLIMSCGRGSGGGSQTKSTTPNTNTQPGVPNSGDYAVFVFNDLGMHCMDRDFSVFSILPPFNVVHAQTIYRNPNGDPVLLDASSLRMRYDAVTDAKGFINTTSKNKTDFWTFAESLFGAGLPLGQGLAGLYMPDDALMPGPQDLSFEASRGWFTAEGIPITPVADSGWVNPYPLMRFSATDKTTGAVLGATDAVVPVSRETDCKNCHTTGGIAATQPGIAWSNDPDPEIQSRTGGANLSCGGKDGHHLEGPDSGLQPMPWTASLNGAGFRPGSQKTA